MIWSALDPRTWPGIVQAGPETLRGAIARSVPSMLRLRVQQPSRPSPKLEKAAFAASMRPP
ncbi:MAG: hypothetical protein HC910_22735 [Spirulinaceae cyanobacterium SM2_1_0]|nr:hypothetical protein [Spirulinaceae cyanobacterium SM2_1_0]